MVTGDDNDGKWRGRRPDRDDTPSVIRNVGVRSQLLGGERRTGDRIPVLSIPASIRLWQKTKWPLLVFVVVISLVAVGYFTNDYLVARNVANRIEDANIGEQSAHVAVLLESHRILETMADRYPGRGNVQAAYAWSSVLISRLFDEPELLTTATRAMKAVSGDRSSVGYAVRAGFLLLQGDLSGAESLISEGLSLYPEEPRLHFLRAWLQLERNEEKTLATLQEVRQAFPAYLPPLYTLIEFGIRQDRRDLVAKYSNELLVASTGNLYGALTSLMVSLPAWNGEPLSGEKTEELSRLAAALQYRVTDTPNKLQVLSRFLSARVALELGDFEEATALFEKIGEDRFRLNVIAWHGRALLAVKGPQAVLTLLDSVEDKPTSEVLDLRTRCYLDHYRVADAEQTLQTAQTLHGFDSRELRWILAVRQANADAAVEMLPDEIAGRLRFVALEMYELLQRTGRRDDLRRLLSVMVDTAESCARQIRRWHEEDIAAVVESVQEPDACAAALGLRMMHTRFRPEVLAEMAERVGKERYAGLRFDVDRSVAIWKTQGREAAVSVLRKILSDGPDAPLLRAAIARVYLSMNLIDAALEVISDVWHPEAVAITYDALMRKNQTQKADALLRRALADEDLKMDPAVQYLELNRRMEGGAMTEVLDAVDEIMDRSGTWASELAEVRASVMNRMGNRGDADRYLATVAQQVISTAGLGESFDVNYTIIRMNMRRGGKFVFKATEVILDMVRKKRMDDSFSLYMHGVVSAREGNVRGAARYLNEAIDIDPTLLPAYEQLVSISELSEERRVRFEQIFPDTRLNE